MTDAYLTCLIKHDCLTFSVKTGLYDMSYVCILRYQQDV